MIEKKKRKGTRGTGRAFEKRCADILEEYGFFTFIAPPKLGWWKDKDTGELKTQSKSQDIFGCVDIIGKRSSFSFTIWVQCGERSTLWKKKQDVQNFTGWIGSDLPLLFMKNEDRTISVFQLCNTGTIGATWFEIGKFDNRRNWVSAPAWVDFSFGTRTPKGKKAIK